MLNIHENNVSAQSIADFGANRILGLNGSLMGYIQTGNPYNKSYYKQGNDAFVRSKNAKRSKNSKYNKTTIVKAISLAAVAICAALSCFLLYKKGVFKQASLTKAKELFSEVIIKKPKEFFSKISKSKAKDVVTENIANAAAGAGGNVAEQSQIDKFNKRFMKADLSYIKKRAENAATPASKKALKEQSQVIENALSNI